MKKNVILLTAIIIFTFNPVKGEEWLSFDHGHSQTIDSDRYQRVYVDYNRTVSPPKGSHAEIVNGAYIDWCAIAYSEGTINMTGGAVGNSVSLYDKSKMTLSGGSIGLSYTSGSGLTAAYDSSFTMSGGILASLGARDNATIEVSGGTINGNLAVSGNAIANISNVSVRYRLKVRENAKASLSSGTIGASILLSDDSFLSMSGGSATDKIHLSSNATMNLSGGSFGGIFQIFQNALVYLDGYDFEVNGQALSYGDRLSDFGVLTEHNVLYDYYYGTITGTLADGTSLNNDFWIHTSDVDATGDIIIVPEPCSLILISLGTLILRSRKA